MSTSLPSSICATYCTLSSKYVQAYSFSGEVQEYNFYPDKIIFQEGYLILLNYREYLWPAQTDIIDKDNVFVGNIGETWDACVLDGDVYYLLPNDFNGRGESLISIVRYNGEQFDILGSIPIDVGDREWWVSAKIDGYVIAVRYEAIRMGQRDEYYNLLDGSPRNSLD